MTATQSVDAAARVTEDWIDDVVQRLGWRDRNRACLALTAGLHALRDCMHQNEAIYLGAQLPILLRGLYYEGWHPASRPTAKSRSAFLARIHDGHRGRVSTSTGGSRNVACWRHSTSCGLKMQNARRTAQSLAEPTRA
jgi:uncharacterized protein (DUF2267 family)